MAEEAEVSSVVDRSALGLRRIGRYEICFEVAAGGMATVYLARLSGVGGFSKLCAVKRIHPHLVGQEGFVEMFLDEARLASRIDHPNVCGVFDFGVGDGSYYIAMDYLVGETVARLFDVAHQRAELSPLPAHASYVARIVSDAAEGLHAAHEVRGDDGTFLNVVHRDVSPQNLMVTYDGIVKVMDFGIASAVDQLHHTKTGTVRGKFAYMSPEQLEGRQADRRADVWSLGVVFWELLTGRHLFGGASEAEAIRAVLDAPIAPPSAARPGVPRELDEVVMRCLARAPDARFATAQALSRAIHDLKSRRVQPVSPAALGDFLKHLFPDLYARRLELVDQARQAQGAEVPRISRMLSEPGVETRRMIEPAAKAERSRGRRAFLTLAGVAGTGALLTLVVKAGPWSGGSTDEAKPAAEAHGSRARPAPKSSAAPVELPAASAVAEPALEARPRAPSRPAAAVATPGSVDVATPGGWADVYVAGRRHGRTPIRLSLPPGRHLIVLKPFGRGVRRHPVTVRSGKTQRLVVNVDPSRSSSAP